MPIYYLLPLFDYVLSFKGVFIIYLIILTFLIYRSGLNLNKISFYNFLLLIVPIFWSCLSSSNFISRDFQRSIFYLSLPPLVFLIGASLSRIVKTSSIYRFIIYYGFISVLLYILFSFFNGNFLNFLNPKVARSTFFFPKPLFCVLSVFLLFYKQQIKGRYLLLFFNIFGLFISGSRTYLLVLLFFIVGRYFKFSFKNILTFVILSVTSSLLIFYSGRFDNLITELTFSSDNLTIDIGSQYRGFESFKAVEKIFSGNILQLVFGFGLNENIDLGLDVDLGGFIMSEIPLLHNGFLYSIIRVGFLGLLFYLLFFYKVIIDSFNKNNKHERYMIVVLTISLLVSNFVINSFYNMEFAISWFLLGFYTNKNFLYEK